MGGMDFIKYNEKKVGLFFEKKAKEDKKGGDKNKETKEKPKKEAKEKPNK